MPDITIAPPMTAVAVPGTNNNQYKFGPFRVSMKSLVRIPDGDPRQKCVQVDVKNTSNSFTGWVAPTVEFVAGHSLKGRLLATEAADPSGGDSGGSSENLGPGQSQVLYACPQVAKNQYSTFQLTKVSYGSADQGPFDGTTMRLQF